FKATFTPDSVEALESAWSGAEFGVGTTRGSWGNMMRGILTEDELKAKITGEEIAEDGETAKVFIDVDGVERTIHMKKIDEEWFINVNLEIDPNSFVLPDDEGISQDELDEMALSDPESEMWWEDREAAEAAKKAEEEGGCFCSVRADTPSGPSPFGVG